MQIISAKYIYKDKNFLQNHAIAFDSKIVKVDTINNLKQKYPDIEVKDFGPNSVIYPGFINPHVHLEFSANRATLKYGDFIEWLYSVIEKREELISKLTPQVLQNAIEQMLNSGVTTFGAISSFGVDLQTCLNTPQRVVYFNEVIGSNPAMVDALFSDFKQRLQASFEVANQKLIPAIAIHSAYSVHPILLKEVLKIAKEKDLITTAHFLESPAEREWLESSSGDFKEFFSKFFNTTKAITTIEEFLNSFNSKPTLFTHATQATLSEIEHINKHNHSIIHCPRSNRLLNCGKLDIKPINNLLLGTDGLSSNYSLSILDELKAALLIHTDINPKELSILLIEAVTSNAQKALNLPIGKIEENFFADFAIFNLPSDINSDPKAIALHTIINSNKVTSLYINGKEVI